MQDSGAVARPGWGCERAACGGRGHAGRTAHLMTSAARNPLVRGARSPQPQLPACPYVRAARMAGPARQRDRPGSADRSVKPSAGCVWNLPTTSQRGADALWRLPAEARATKYDFDLIGHALWRQLRTGPATARRPCSAKGLRRALLLPAHRQGRAMSTKRFNATVFPLARIWRRLPAAGCA